MPIVSLPDGAKKEIPANASVFDVAMSIGKGLAKAAIAGKFNDQLVDLSFPILEDGTIAIITDKSPEALEILRHSSAHVLAQAIAHLYPDAQFTIGPVVEDGFYYDLSCSHTFTPDDLPKIEVEMQRIIADDIPVTRKTYSREAAIAFFKERGQHYKVKIIEEIPAGETLSLYTQGDFTDLCRGPHIPSTGKIKAVKLTKLAGAYWKGDSNNEMLQRIYGTAWLSQADLDLYLTRQEEAEKRDHRKIGAAQDLFHIQPEAPGMIFWHEKGWAIYLALMNYIRNLLKPHGYQEIHTPQVVDISLWQKSGHADKYSENMFIVTDEEREFAIKPMNCPCHIQVFNQGLRSYRDLPMRLAEFGSCHRKEPSGTLHGLMRIRNFVQDDAHIFCTEDQIATEISSFIDLVFTAYRDLGFDKIDVILSTRPAKRVGSDEIWDKAEHALEKVLNSKGIDWKLCAGDGAFYGPKIEFKFRDCLNREWTCGTVQLDFMMPERLGSHYIAEDGSKKVPVMIHRAVLGSIERTIGILLEHYAGALPFWLSPIQVAVMNITDKQADYVTKVTKNLQEKGFRVISDLRNEKVGFKIRTHTLSKVPYLLIVGDREVETQTVSVRTRAGTDLGSMSLEACISKLMQEQVIPT